MLQVKEEQKGKRRREEEGAGEKCVLVSKCSFDFAPVAGRVMFWPANNNFDTGKATCLKIFLIRRTKGGREVKKIPMTGT